MEEFDDPTRDPQYYKLGFFYVNKADSRIFVPKRYGIGYTMNFGKPLGIILFVAVIFFAIYYAATR